MRVIGFVTLLIIVVMTGPGFGAQRLQVAATRITEPPVLDGKLTDACWKAAVPVTGFRQLGGETPAQYQSFGYVLYDEENLYIGVRCLEPHPQSIVTTTRNPRVLTHEEDENVFNDDAVEIMIKSDPDRPRHFQFAISASGATFDAIRTHGGSNVDTRWNGEMAAAAAIAQDHWSAELHIPFYCLELSPQVGSQWRINICRDKQRPRELSAISFEGLFNETWKFAVLSGLEVDFGKYCIEVGKPQLVGEVKDGTPSASATLSLTNSTGKDRRLKIEYLSDDAPAASPCEPRGGLSLRASRPG